MDPSGSPAEPAGNEYVIDQRAWRICDMPERMRPREELERVGVANVSDDVLLAVLLRAGTRGKNVADLAREMLVKHGSLTQLGSCSADDLCRDFKGVGRVKAQVILAALELARRLAQESLPKRYRVRTPEDAARLLRDTVRVLSSEVFWVLLLDTKNYLKRPPVEVTRGLLDASLVHPREVFRDAIRCATAAVVVVHNHPSGDPTPSAEDVRITRQLVEAGKVVGISVLDHVVLGKSTQDGSREYMSLREEGLVTFG
jgi:DNA repair protein RadC